MREVGDRVATNQGKQDMGSKTKHSELKKVDQIQECKGGKNTLGTTGIQNNLKLRTELDTNKT